VFLVYFPGGNFDISWSVCKTISGKVNTGAHGIAHFEINAASTFGIHINGLILYGNEFIVPAKR